MKIKRNKKMNFSMLVLLTLFLCSCDGHKEIDGSSKSKVEKIDSTHNENRYVQERITITKSILDKMPCVKCSLHRDDERKKISIVFEDGKDYMLQATRDTIYTQIDNVGLSENEKNEIQNFLMNEVLPSDIQLIRYIKDEGVVIVSFKDNFSLMKLYAGAEPKIGSYKKFNDEWYYFEI